MKRHFQDYREEYEFVHDATQPNFRRQVADLALAEYLDESAKPLTMFFESGQLLPTPRWLTRAERGLDED